MDILISVCRTDERVLTDKKVVICSDTKLWLPDTNIKDGSYAIDLHYSRNIQSLFCAWTLVPHWYVIQASICPGISLFRRVQPWTVISALMTPQMFYSLPNAEGANELWLRFGVSRSVHAALEGGGTNLPVSGVTRHQGNKEAATCVGTPPSPSHS